MESSEVIRKLDRIKKLPTLPVVAMEVAAMTDSPSVTAKGLAETLENDQALVTSVLKLVNSPFYGLRSRVLAVSDAVVLLGFQSIRNIVIAAAVLQVSKGQDFDSRFDIVDFWKHAIAVGVTSRHLSSHAGVCGPDDCFVAGLLHDIGKLIQALVFKSFFVSVLERMKEENRSYVDAESELTRYGHDKIGGYIAEKWKLPSDLRDAIQFHHRGTRAAVNMDLHYIVNAANVIVNSFISDSIHPAHSILRLKRSLILPGAEKRLRKSLDELHRWFPGANTEIIQAWELFSQEVAGEWEKKGED